MSHLKKRIFAFILCLGLAGVFGGFAPATSYAATLLDAPLISQLPELKNGCEVTSLAMLLQYRGIPVSKMTLANQVIKDPTPYRVVGGVTYWGNPNTGFVGDITGQTIGYAAYHGPIFQLAKQYANVIDLTGNSFDVIGHQLDKGKPVWVISTSTFDTVPDNQWQTIQTPLGPLLITFHEHSVLLTGYDANYVYFNDPLANIKNRKVSRAAFIRGWEQFGRQAITYGSSVGIIDNPNPGANLNDVYNVSGWFLDESGVSKIEVLVDGTVAGQAVYGDPRADVQNAYPDYNNGSSGFHYALETARYSSGNHTITVRETGTNGWVTTLPERSVTFSNAKGVIDNPVPDSKIKGKYTVSGWFLDENGVSKLDVLLDGNVIGQAVYNDSRPDVQKAYPNYNNGNAGFHYSLDTANYSDGTHTLTVRETAANGRVTTLPNRTITIENVRGYLESPETGANVKGKVNVSGWFLDDSGVSTIDVLVDGTIVGQANYGDSRSDVQRVFPEYNNGSSGFHYLLDTTKLTDGQHTISIRETGVNGKISALPEKTITVKNIIGYIDSPASNLSAKGQINVSGWFLDESGVSKIEVLVDGTVAGEANYGDSREDVRKAFPEFNNGSSGFHYLLDTTRFSDGSHKVTIRETGTNGNVTTMPERTLIFENVKGYLDQPGPNTNIIGKTTVSGWFLDRGGVSKVEVLVDGQVAGQAVYGDPRADVLKAFPDYNNSSSGFHYILDSTKYSDGNHTLTVRETRANGVTATLPESTISISNVKGYIDSPVNGQILKGTAAVSGWFLDMSGVAKIEVLLDGAVAGEAVYGDSRADVKSAFPAYNNGTSGYHFLMDTTKISDGSHTITIKETGANGQVTTLPVSTVTISNAQ